MNRKYYFDNSQGNRNFSNILKEAEALSGATSMGYESLFYKYINVLDPSAEIVSELDNSAVVLVELNNHVTPPVIDYLIDKISVTDNTVFVSMTETIIDAIEYSQRHGIKFITMPVMHDTDTVKNLALIQPFLVTPDLYPTAPATITTGPKDYLFLNLNRRVTASRLAMHAALDIAKLIATKPYVVSNDTKGLVSMHWVTDSIDYEVNEIGSDTNIMEHAIELSKLATVKTIPIKASAEYSHWKFKSSHHYPKWYNDTWFSLVTESSAHTHYVSKPCLTEKTVMPILIGHPFLLYADHGAINLLRELGFDTFDWLFDHSYDTELDAMKKLKSVLRQIKNFNVTTALAENNRINEAIKFNRAHYRSDAVKQAVAAEWQTAIEELM